MAVYGTPIGIDFIHALIDGFRERWSDPLEIARVSLVVNSTRAQQNIREAFLEAFGLAPEILTLPQFVSHYRPAKRRKADSELSQVLAVAELLRQANSDHFPFENSHIFELSYHLVDLLDQCLEHDKTPQDLLNLPLDDFAEHWKLNAELFAILLEYWNHSQQNLEATIAQEEMNALAHNWSKFPPQNPVYVVGSTGSRPIMRQLMAMILRHELGGVIFPLVDFDPHEGLGADHPQFGIQDVLNDFRADGLEVELTPWHEDTPPLGKVLHVAMAPPPYTDLWLDALPDVKANLSQGEFQLSWMEAKTGHEESDAIAVAVYEKVKEGKSVAVVCNDRTLVRRLVGRLDDLGLDYDDSAGRPLHLAPSAVFAALLLDAKLKADRVRAVALLSHPFTSRTSRAAHLKALRHYEKKWLRNQHNSNAWRADVNADDFAENAAWIEKWAQFFESKPPEAQPLGDWVNWHLDAMREVSGIEKSWSELGGADRGDLELFDAMETLASDAGFSANLSLQDYIFFWNSWVAREPSLKQTLNNQAQIRILGKFEMRTESADAVIFAAMNEGQWPDAEIPDMWLNRALRIDLGLETPERFIGLSAHDFLAGFGAKELILSRALKSDDAPQIESRFLTRLRVLLRGADAEYFKAAKARGDVFVKLGREFDLPVSPESRATRPAIALPAEKRPKTYAVTAIEGMLKNPYRAYAQSVLGLYELSSLSDEFGAKEQGTLAHLVFEELSPQKGQPMTPLSSADYQSKVHEIIDGEGLDFGDRFRVENIFADIEAPYLVDENIRRQWADEIDVEKLRFAEIDANGHTMTLRARFDRMDLRDDGAWRLFDYKSGHAPYNTLNFKPSKALQLPLMAMMIEYENGVAPDLVAVLKYKNEGKSLNVPLIDYDYSAFFDDFGVFLKHYYADDFTFTSAFQSSGYDGAYEHLARFGEWLDSDEPEIVRVGYE